MNTAWVLKDSNQIEFFRLRTLRMALRLELRGMHRRGRSAYRILRDEYGFKGSKQAVLAKMENLCL